MIPQIHQRKLGSVMIVDVEGSLTGPWALRGKDEMRYFVKSAETHQIVFNLANTEGMDSLGVKSLFENIPADDGISVILGNRGVMNTLEHYCGNKRFRVFRNETEVIAALGDNDVVRNPSVGTDADGRLSPRLRTSVPLEFYYKDDEDILLFKGIVTNMSLGGLFAEYIDLANPEQSLEGFDPKRMKTLQLVVFLPHRKPLSLEGEVAHIHSSKEQLGIGIKFERLQQSQIDEINKFLKLQQWVSTN
ncbi:MAG: hypothetical protein A3G33_00855 [Omnitrophica bacterium RIFCSPLOWO2_12_FULL_44_17]|uniref:PilZ domain-containing protein n=1 Tax=Candidatus Danuiimicrobium aquiferis TaxID=1801832 RepID=A0A1G1L3I2_9BACT|nr:MAG: hypothetical protein A3B72_06335 [Omnitrophica bacterium RIFCSPHIGHO2_02_FULL_45_28]OGW89785.1 MAG: hypothetical protein A3E74_07465 [Omnitrophica bacterium RIFCSPHIGHO2_12_FULL_44_12]OGW99429.1 MAG: hypothetical protein A3G33_00855 [Omnitrophica bacterium RIFCSPLOWO2_12_FULL_44_17]OGX03041.1 MAG: hypothetical protein A3J12_04840 [Omnitrophica bacterium RIFCSPLOWO2_02_FULL_44_11]